MTIEYIARQEIELGLQYALRHVNLQAAMAEQTRREVTQEMQKLISKFEKILGETKDEI